ncbi:unnamed protein product [Polarella glacialis]|uniref:Uncharacterized protein n=1 Tax=Polarella glacialis TaxID=89957 RepID=A0A813K7V9_POLGL|nr:unnamed protein product [Polarella glacialis]
MNYKLYHMTNPSPHNSTMTSNHANEAAQDLGLFLSVPQATTTMMTTLRLVPITFLSYHFSLWLFVLLLFLLLTTTVKREILLELTVPQSISCKAQPGSCSTLL